MLSCVGVMRFPRGEGGMIITKGGGESPFSMNHHLGGEEEKVRLSDDNNFLESHWKINAIVWLCQNVIHDKTVHQVVTQLTRKINAVSDRALQKGYIVENDVDVIDKMAFKNSIRLSSNSVSIKSVQFHFTEKITGV